MTSPFEAVSLMARELGLDPRDVRGPRKNSVLVDARRAIAVRLRAMNLSWPEVGRALGGRHHTTAMALCRALPSKPRSKRAG